MYCQLMSTNCKLEHHKMRNLKDFCYQILLNFFPKIPKIRNQITRYIKNAGLCLDVNVISPKLLVDWYNKATNKKFSDFQVCCNTKASYEIENRIACLIIKRQPCRPSTEPLRTRKSEMKNATVQQKLQR